MTSSVDQRPWLSALPQQPSTRARAPMRRWLRTRPTVAAWVVTAVFFALYAAVSVLRHRRMATAGYDLGIFEEAVRAYAHGHAPVVELKGPGFNLLGDHFHPVLVVLAPLYRAFPSPVTLLVAQAALMAAACLPLTRWAHRAVGPGAGLVVGCGVGASWGMVSAVSFDFHEVCFAVPLLAFAVEALGNGRWRAAACWTLPLLLVKEDLGLTVAAVGALIVWRGPRRWGWVLVAAGLAGTALEMAVLLPAVNPHGTFDYWRQMSDGGGGGGPAQLLRVLWPPSKWLLLLMVAAPTALLGLRSSLLLLCVPTLAWRLLSDNPHHWSLHYHYSALLMPVVLGGLVDVLGRRPRVCSPGRARVALTACAAFTAVTAALYPLHELVTPSSWRTPAHVRSARAVLGRIPDGARVAATNRLSAQLTGRSVVGIACGATPPGPWSPVALPDRRPDWVVADRTDSDGFPLCGSPVRVLAAYRAAGYRTVVQADGVVLLNAPAVRDGFGAPRLPAGDARAALPSG
ncbi:DUF2079 domain-containing protein [Streptomyces sp. NPDC092296]|uniref:DUF2079 domain-containing protein n=1 Tax=Streptomyces sp. NPDC092296 TaxID=3366012 RepID=UPI0037F5E310